MEEEVEPVICKLCDEEIKVDQVFIEVYTNLGVKEQARGYVKGARVYWDRDTDYAHLHHFQLRGA